VNRYYSPIRAEVIRQRWALATPAERTAWLKQAHAASKCWWASKTPEERSQTTAKALAAALEATKAKWAAMTPEERREATAKARAAVKHPGRKRSCDCGICPTCLARVYQQGRRQRLREEK
jgi:hypothetical protein